MRWLPATASALAASPSHQAHLRPPGPASRGISQRETQMPSTRSPAGRQLESAGSGINGFQNSLHSSPGWKTRHGWWEQSHCTQMCSEGHVHAWHRQTRALTAAGTRIGMPMCSWRAGRSHPTLRGQPRGDAAALMGTQVQGPPSPLQCGMGDAFV